MPSLIDVKGEWASAIGKAFVAFGSIEHVTVVCLQEIPRDRIQRSTRSFGLGQRIDILREILEEHVGAEFEELSKKLSQAKILAKKRNLIAHNPLVLDVYQKSDGTYFHKEIIASLKKKDEHITLSQLVEFSDKAEKLASELYSSSLRVFAALASKAKA